jgi:hypothetical protein
MDMFGMECADVAWCIGQNLGKPPVRPVVSETAPKPGWDANGTPIEQGEAL